jgi:thiol-disulfide isomerase/thioredoxin
VREQVAQLIIEAANPPDTSLLTEIVGRVVDQAGKGIGGATVECHGNVLTIEEYRKKTDEDGGFRVRGAFHWSPPGETPAFAIIAAKDGYTGAKVTHVFTAAADGAMRLKDPLVLRPGYSARAQVLGETGQPLEGAWAVGSNLADYQIFKSDSQGLCLLQNLPEGETTVRFSYGGLGASETITAGPATADAPPVIVRLGKMDFFTPSARPKPQLLAVGEMAPDWSVRQWNDGNERTLADLKGRVVVIGFWDWGCGPCRKITMPVESRLALKYAKDVTFIHIHPATDEPHLVQEIIQKEGWNLIMGIDNGTGSTDSVTLKRYGVGGFPTEFIVDRQGRVVDNGDLGATGEERLAKMRVLAEEAKLPWPLEKDASEEETIRRMKLFHEFWMTKRIEAALAGK